MALNKRYRILSGVLVLAAAIAAAFYMRGGTSVRSNMEATGVVEARELNLSPKSAGRIEFLCCNVGDGISSGAVAIRLDAREAGARLKEAEARLKAAEESVNEARINLEAGRHRRDSYQYQTQASGGEVDRLIAIAFESRDNLERAKGLFKEGFISRKEMDASQTAHDANMALLGSAKAALKAAESSVKTAVLGVRSAESGLKHAEAMVREAEAELELNRTMLDELEVKSPINGIVVYRALEAGEMAGPGDAVYTIHDLKDIWVLIDIEETEISGVVLGGEATVHLPSNPEKQYRARITEISAIAGFATQKDVQRGMHDIKTFRVKAGIIEPDGMLKPGMTAGVRIKLH